MQMIGEHRVSTGEHTQFSGFPRSSVSRIVTNNRNDGQVMLAAVHDDAAAAADDDDYHYKC